MAGSVDYAEDELRAVHLMPYRSAIEAGAMSVMASYSSWNGRKLHAHEELLTGVLKGELGFRGFVVSDWMGVDQIGASYHESVVAAINAGIDMVMVPEEWRRFIDVMATAVSNGEISIQRIDDAVIRILSAKESIGLFETDHHQPPLSSIGSSEHRALAAEAVRRSAVLLENSGALPIAGGIESLVLAGVAADDIGLQCGGWTVGWQGSPGPITDGTTLLDGLKEVFGERVRYSPDGRLSADERVEVAVVCVAERPYAEGPGDRAVPTVTEEDRAVFTRVRRQADRVVLVIYSGRPLVIPDLIEQADAVVAAWLPGSHGAALAEPLVGSQPFEGSITQPWPATSDLEDQGGSPLFEIGHGLRLPASNNGGIPNTPSASR